MFPGAGASVQYNENGEPESWDYPMEPGEDTYYLDIDPGDDDFEPEVDE